MMTPAQFSHVLGLVESSGNEYAWGDSGRALGRFQVHPAWLFEAATRYAIQPTVDDTWDIFVERVVLAFFASNIINSNPLKVAMHFHRGHEVEPSDPDWDVLYSGRFADWCDKLGIAI